MPFEKDEIKRIRKQIRDLAQWSEREVYRVDKMSHCAGWDAGMEAPGFDDAKWEIIASDSWWGRRFSDEAFRFVLPPLDKPQDGYERFLVIEPGMREIFLHPETHVFIDGVSCAAFDREHHHVAIEGLFDPSVSHHITLKVFAGIRDDKKQFAFVGIRERHRTTDQLYRDAKALYETALILDESAPERAEILYRLPNALVPIQRHDVGSQEFIDSIEKAADEVAKLLADLAWEWPARPRITAVGHAHLDTEWLWRLKHTREKLERNVIHTLALLDRYPEYVYFQSQAIQYAFLKKDRPDLFEKVRERVKEGRWNANGALWVEPDTNMPSGESMIRQFLYGTRFFEEEFGVTRHILWLVDTFGYTAALPQIMKGFNVPLMITTKLSWNRVNQFPHDTFRWKGLDGSEVFVDQITCVVDQPIEGQTPWFRTYNAVVTPNVTLGTWASYRHKHLVRERLFSAGYGDGGGGANVDMIETARRLKAMPGLPSFGWGLVEDYAERILEKKEQFPEYDGELYLEDHRGTYTSQALVKKNNRKTEFMLHNAEFLGAWAQILGAKYNIESIREAWEVHLLKQFHDILPGSSVSEVYQDAAEAYQAIQGTLKNVAMESIDVILEKAKLKRSEKNTSEWAIFNTLSFPRGGICELNGIPEESGIFDYEGHELLTQRVDGKDKTVLVDIPEVPSYGYALVHVKRKNTRKKAATVLEISERTLENEFLRIEIDNKGEIVSILDKEREREVVCERERANRLLLFEDNAPTTSAWNIDFAYNRKSWTIDALDELKIIERGPLRAGWEIKRSFMKSHLTQRIYLRHNSRRIDFVTEVDWHEQDMMLKASFPVEVRAKEANCEIQFGHIARPMTRNNSFELARYEIPAHRWIDASEDDYGVSLLNDCKYGHDVQQGALRITLLRGTVKPDPVADIGQHEFTYAIYPHPGRLSDAGVVGEGFDLNQPLMIIPLSTIPDADKEPQCFISVDPANIIVDTVKPSEDEKDIIVRLYESAGRRSKGKLKCGFSPKTAHESDMRETPRKKLTLSGDSCECWLRPFEIKTIRFSL